ncbi:hypothetical protein DBV05_g8067 [Lasiodiplodia theobromae]|uniref:NAD(P)-binding domain-containing protein n=1 Tax=Lasiodiplodia theobromae TaxID=45133 RepID=A0A5N5D643_9PEZI|nr:hypothetical protein DBV05_g8067 [Lasiodiplodia theobromae]
MHFYILGGNGRSGQLVIDDALQRGHTVTALVRNPGSLEPRKGLTVAKGTPLSKEDIEASFVVPARPDAVIVTLNSARASDSPFAVSIAPRRMMADSHANVTAVMQQHGVSKIVTMSAFGVADSDPNVFCAIRAVLRKTNMKFQFEDHDFVDEEMKQSGANFVLVRPAMLTEGENLPVQVFGNSGEGAGWIPKISRKSVAHFILDACETGTWDRQTPVIAN